MGADLQTASASGLTAEKWVRQIFTYAPFTSLFNTTGQPAISLPLEQDSDGLLQRQRNRWLARRVEERCEGRIGEYLSNPFLGGQARCTGRLEVGAHSKRALRDRLGQ